MDEERNLADVLKSLKTLFTSKKTEDSREQFLEYFGMLLAAGRIKGFLNPDEDELLTNVLDFQETIVREIMIPRTDMACLSDQGDFTALLKLVAETGHAHIPLYHEQVDRIVGVIRIRDLFRFWGKETGKLSLKSLSRPAFFVPETKKAFSLLRELQNGRLPLAIVVDEYGGVSGLVTIEDILEELVGKIYFADEVPNRSPEKIEVQEDGSIKISAKMEIDELNDYFAVEIEKKDFDTVSGLLIHLMGHIPHKGEKIAHHNLLFTVLAADEKRVKKVKVNRVVTIAESSPAGP